MTDAFPDYPDVVLAVVCVDCADPLRLATFWGALLGRKVIMADDDRVDLTTAPFVNLEWAPRFGAGLIFQRVPEAKVAKNRVHMDIFCADVDATKRRVEELGGRPADDLGPHVMFDPEGNEFCLVRAPGA